MRKNKASKCKIMVFIKLYRKYMENTRKNGKIKGPLDIFRDPQLLFWKYAGLFYRNYSENFLGREKSCTYSCT